MTALLGPCPRGDSRARDFRTMTGHERAFLFLLFVSLLGGCSGEGLGGQGDPCEVDEDCESGLVCDMHSGQGSCQEAHDHS